MNKKLEDKILEIRNSGGVTRSHISELLSMIGKPGKKQDEKIAAIKELQLENPQGYRVEDNLADYEEF